MNDEDRARATPSAPGAAAAGPVAAGRAEPPVTAGGPESVLVCVRERRRSRRLVQALEAGGFRVQECSGAKDVAASLDAGCAGVAVLDRRHLPEADLELIQAALDRQPLWSDVPVLLVGAAPGAGPQRSDAAMLWGNVTVLPAPLRAPALRAWVSRALARRRRQLQLRAELHSVDGGRRRSAADAARVEWRRLGGILEVMPVGIFLADADGRVVEMNTAARRIWEGDAPRKPPPHRWGDYRAWWAADGRPVRPEEWALSRAVTSGEIGLAEEMEIEDASGRRKAILNYALPIRDALGRIAGGIAINVDITERRQMEQALAASERSYRTLAFNLPALVYRVWLREGRRMQFYNNLVEEITGYRESELGHGEVCSIEPFIVEEDRSRVVEAVAASLVSGEPFEVEYRLRRKDGEIRHLHERGRPVPGEDGRPVSIDGVIADVTERKRAVEELEGLRAGLERLVEERTAELARANLELREQARRLEIQHEIGLEILAAGSAADVASAVVERLRRVVPCLHATVVVFDEAGEEAVVLASAGEVGVRPEVGARAPAWVATPGEPGREGVTIVSNVAAHPATARPAFLGPGAGSFLEAPLAVEGAVLGALVVAGRGPDAFADRDALLASAVAASLTLAIRNARLFDEVRRSRERLEVLFSRLAEVRDDEQRRIAGELHDDAGQMLTSLAMGLDMLGREPGDPAAVARRARELGATAGEVMDSLHRLAVSLRPASLDHLGLVAALRQRIEALAEHATVRVRFAAAGLDNTRLDPGMETRLYRIVVEALTNVVRHSGARNVGVVVERRGDNVVAIVEDDGRGFDPATAMDVEHTGLFGISERVALMGGTLQVESRPGEGTSIFVEVPIDLADRDR